jgi:3-isopropylmalate dehydratase small subunit
MQAFTVHKGLVAPMDRDNVDTDAIIPKQFLKSIRAQRFRARTCLTNGVTWTRATRSGPRQSQAEPRFRAQPATLQGCLSVLAGAQELRVRLLAASMPPGRWTNSAFAR